MAEDISFFSSETFDSIQKRRSVKVFDKNHKFSDTDVEKILSLAMLSPTSYNIQHWRFLIVKDKELRKKIRDASFDQSQVTDASLLLILCADLKAWENAKEYWKNAPKETRDFLVKDILMTFQNNDQLQRDEAIRSIGIAAQTIMLAVKSAGYDSCPMIGFEQKKVGNLINLPKNYIIGMMLAIGKAKQPPNPRGGQLSMEKIIFTDKF